MLKDITIGQFFPGNSPIHKLDPRTKILFTLLYIVFLFLIRNYISLILLSAFIFLMILTARIPLSTVGKSIRPLTVILIFTAVLQLFTNREGDPLWRPFPEKDLMITSDGVAAAVFLVIRILALVVSSSLLTYTTSPTVLTDAIEKLLSPLRLFHIKVQALAMMMTIAIRFIPTLVEETQIIMNAQRARGARFEQGSVRERLHALVSVFVPLFVSAFRRAAELAVAMESRCYTDGSSRTRLREMRFSLRDAAALLISLCLFGGAVYLSFFPPVSSILFNKVI